MGDPSPVLKGGLADRYRIESELGRGGMATVYRAHDIKHDRPVALKVLHPHLAAVLGPERFQREIHFAARLQHPHILTVLDSGETEGHLWFTMPLVEGETLRARLRREPQLPLADALRIGREAAEALHYAHEHGVVHRDVKPENILLTRDGNTLVADFGIARALGEQPGRPAGGQNSQLTETGVIIGTPAYMSPEQASGGRQLDARSDVYALGAVLYEALAGEPAFSGSSAQAILAQRFRAPPPSVRRTHPEVPPAVDAAIQRALALEPADRFSTAAELGKALERAASEGGSDAPRAGATPLAATARLRKHWTARLRTLGLAIAGALILALGAIFLARRTGPSAGPEGPAGPKRLAVLPFEHQGDSTDAFFADGVTDAVRGKLTALPGLEVLASYSSNQYRHTTKTPRQIGRELKVDYLLIGKVRWAKGAGAASRVQVSPELIDVSRATARWQQPFEAALTDVFRVQADIAGQVAQALGVALDPSERHRLATKPTASLAAYQAYLKGEAVGHSVGVGDAESLRRAADYYEQAVALDSTFVEAWAQLSRAYTMIYVNTTPAPAVATAARRAAQRAIALAPASGEARFALGQYHHQVSGDGARALEAYTSALELAPTNAELLTATAVLETNLGEWERALDYLTRAQRLDPRSVWAARWRVAALLWLRRHAEALAAAERGLAIDATNLDMLEWNTMAHLARGDLRSARAAIRAASAEIEPKALAAFFAAYFDLMWVLDDTQRQLVLGLRPRAFFNDRGVWAIVLAQTYALEGNHAKARIYADSARLGFEEQLRKVPNDGQRMAFLGLALAYLGRRAEAVQAGQRGVALQPATKDATFGPYVQHQLARIYILVGEPEKALDQLERLLKIPYYLSPGWLRIDPTFDPLRKHPRFQALVGGS